MIEYDADLFDGESMKQVEITHRMDRLIAEQYLSLLCGDITLMRFGHAVCKIREQFTEERLNAWLESMEVR